MSEIDVLLRDLKKYGNAGRDCALSAEDALTIAAALEAAREDMARLDYIERTFSGMTNRERYLPVTMGWGAPCNGRTLREACDKYMKRDAMAAGEGAK